MGNTTIATTPMISPRRTHFQLIARLGPGGGPGGRLPPGGLPGGGFGGATINLVDARYAGEFKEKMAKSYQRETGLVPQIYICRPAEGAGPFPSSDL